jgi:hypothetical protein
MTSQNVRAWPYHCTASPSVNLLASGYTPNTHSMSAATTGMAAAPDLEPCGAVTRYGIKRYFSTRNSSRAATPADPFFIISSISLSSRGSCDTHSTPCVVAM